MSSQRSRPAFGISFFGMVGAVMAALKLKEHVDGYKTVANDDEEGRVALVTSPASPTFRDQPEDSVSLLDTQLGAQEQRTKRKRKSCCMCCGMDCGLFWKAIGIVVGIFAIWNAFKLVMWAIKPSPTGLEGMPVYSTSLGCLSAPHLYNGSEVTMKVPIGSRLDHSFDIRGSAVGTFIIAEGPTDSTEVVYNIAIRSDDQALLDHTNIQLPEGGSRLLINTPHTDASSESCQRFDITMFVPKTLKHLHVAAHAPTHVQFDPATRIDLDGLFVTLFAMEPKNMILPHENVKADKMSLEVYRGWIVGDAAIVNSTAITTQRGDGVANVRVHPMAPVDPASPDPAFLQTTTGAGRTDIFYISRKEFPHRPIRSVHMSSRNADIYLTYQRAEFGGLIELNSKSYTATGLQSVGAPTPEESADPNTGGKPKWTHWVGDKDGGDKMFVKSRGWTGLYF